MRSVECGAVNRDPALRERYLQLALSQIPRLLGAVDRNPYHATYGCFDRQFWHYRTASFASEMYQEAVLPLALVYGTPLPGNRWHGEPRVRELVIAALRFAARNSHRDGSCDDYYPYERALGAAVFSLQAAARAYELLELDDAAVRTWLIRRARWIVAHDESGRLTNHQALAALGLARAAQITGDDHLRRAADQRVARVLAWQSPEGWFEEYGGADPGYQTVTIDALAKLRRLTGDGRLDEPLRRAVAFARLFLHVDGSYAGEYGSRGTYHFYPHGFELLAPDNRDAAELADAFLRSIDDGKLAAFDDDRMYVHRLGNLMEAYLDWSPTAPVDSPPHIKQSHAAPALAAGFARGFCYLPAAGVLVHRAGRKSMVVSASRGGVLKLCRMGQVPQTDTGLIVETADGRQAVAQYHDPARAITWRCGESASAEADHAEEAPMAVLTISGPLRWIRHETATPVTQAVFHLAMVTIGRWCRGLVRRLLQRRLIAPPKTCPVQLTRTFEFLNGGGDDETAACRVTDQIELLDPRLHVRRMSFSTDLQSTYTAAANVYQESVLAPWTDLESHVDQLNRHRQVTIVRSFGDAKWNEFRAMRCAKSVSAPVRSV